MSWDETVNGTAAAAVADRALPEDEFLRAIYSAAQEPLPQRVIDNSIRNLLNVLATALGASGDSSVDALVEGLGRTPGGTTGGTPVPVIGRADRLDPAAAALVSGFAAHLDDFDDTDLQTVIHPSAAPMAALLSAAWLWKPTGADLLRAFAIGCELQLRAGRSISPHHYDDGWHITGTCGVLGASAAVAVLADLPYEAFSNAIRLAATASLGLREGFGSSLKPWNAGKAASNGLQAAFLARRGVSVNPAVLSGPNSFFQVLSSGYDPKALLDSFGTDWILNDNMIKPYPCGIVTHPCIDGGILLHEQIEDHSEIADIEVRCNPLVVDLTGNLTPQNGLEARFSTVHGVSVGVAYGTVGLREYRDDIVGDPLVSSLRSKCRLVPSPDVSRESAELTAVLADGSRITVRVDQARGSLERPLSDSELESKVFGLADTFAPGRGREMVDVVNGITELTELSTLWDCLLPTGWR